MEKHLFFILFVVISCISCEKEETDKFDYEVELNSQFQIELAANPSAGYSWIWVNKQTVAIVDSVDHEFIADNDELIGSPGKEFWIFKGVKTGVDTLKLKYCQINDLNTAIENKEVIIKVE